VNDCDNCPTKVENERLKASLRTVEAHKLKDIADLEGYIQELQERLRDNHNGKGD